MSNDPTEIRKGMLDLLDKINAVSPAAASGQSIKSVSEDYYFGIDDGVTDLFVTTSSGTVTVYLDKSSRNIGRVLRVWKADAGTGEVKITGWNGTESISGYANVYVGLQYQHADIYQNGTTNFNIGQYIQPVAGEPSCGTPHVKSVTLVNNVDPTTSSSVIVTCSDAPVGSMAIGGMYSFRSSSVGDYINITDMGGVVYGQAIIQVANQYMYGTFMVPLDSSRQFRYQPNSASIDSIYIYQKFYYL